MSRTPKRGKAPGTDYWAARPFAGDSAKPSRGRVSTKTLTHRLERRERKRLAWEAQQGGEPVSRWPKTA